MPPTSVDPIDNHLSLLLGYALILLPESKASSHSSMSIAATAFSPSHTGRAAATAKIHGGVEDGDARWVVRIGCRGSKGGESGGLQTTTMHA